MSDKGSISRRYFISRTAAGLAATALFSSSLDSIMLPTYKIKAIAFDAFPIFESMQRPHHGVVIHHGDNRVIAQSPIEPLDG